MRIIKKKHQDFVVVYPTNALSRDIRKTNRNVVLLPFSALWSSCCPFATHTFQGAGHFSEISRQGKEKKEFLLQIYTHIVQMAYAKARYIRSLNVNFSIRYNLFDF